MANNITKEFKEDILKKIFKKYKDYTDKFIKEFGLGGWEIFIVIEVDSDPDVQATTVLPGGSQKQISILLNKKWLETIPSDYEIMRVAYHEVLEVILVKINRMLLTEYSEFRVNEEIHAIIRKLEAGKFGLETRE